MNLTVPGLGFLLLLTSACSSVPPLPVTVRQDGQQTTTSQETAAATLRRAPFSLRFSCQPYDEKKELYHAVHVVVTTTAEAQADIKVGLKTADSPYLEEGSGMAGTDQGYTAVMPDIVGQHYLYYASPRDHRVELLGTNPDGTQQLEWNITNVMLEGSEQEIPLPATTMPALYFAVFIDKNLDEQIQAGELTKLKVKFTD
jgi:hypothetical protein